MANKRFAAARLQLNMARAKIEAGEGDGPLLARIDALDIEISKGKAVHEGESLREGNVLPLADLITRAQASLSRQKFDAARRLLGMARAEIEAGDGDDATCSRRLMRWICASARTKASHQKGS